MSARALLNDSAVPVGKTAVSAIAWQYKGELRVSAVVKAVFAFDGDGVMTLTEPQPVLGEDVHHARNPLRSIQFGTDLVPYRRRADVLFTGYAHAPGGGTVEAMNVRLALLNAGERPLVDKTLLVRKKGGFQKLRISYDYAVGGSGHADNPFGEGFPGDASPGELHVWDPVDASRVAGFAPIAQTMNPRLRLLGGLPLPAFGRQIVHLPDAFDFDFFQTAPLDQRTDFLKGDEWIVLEGLHPTSARLRLRLPGVACVARIHGLAEFGVREGQPLAMYADTLHVNGDEQRCLVTWRGSFPVRGGGALASARIVAGVELPGAPIAWPDAAELALLRARAAAGPSPGARGGAPRAAGDVERTLALSDDDFVVVSTAGAGGKKTGSETLPISSPTPAKARKHATLPFRSSSPAAPLPAQRTVARGAGSGGETLPIPSSREEAPRPSALPFPAAEVAPSTPAPAVEPPLEEPPTLPIARPEPPVVRPEPPVIRPEPVVHAEPPVVHAEPPAEPLAPAKAAAASPWAPQPEAPPPAPPKPPEKKAPPKVNVSNKLYGKKR
jgi:hypothetical protein